MQIISFITPIVSNAINKQINEVPQQQPESSPKWDDTAIIKAVAILSLYAIIGAMV